MPRKTILITGCGPTSIGYALATEFQLRGHRVIAFGLDNNLLQPLQDLGMYTTAMDVTWEQSIAAAVSHVAKIADGRIDTLINNAGVIQIMPLADTSIADARRLFEVNVLGAMAVTQAFLPLLVRSAATAGAGAVVANLGSVHQVLCPPFFSAYNASKAAGEALTTTMRRKLAPPGVRAVLLKTGSVRTGFLGNALGETTLPEGSLYTPLREWIEGRQMELQGRHVDSDVYARGVVDELLRDNIYGTRAETSIGKATSGLFNKSNNAHGVHSKSVCNRSSVQPASDDVLQDAESGKPTRRWNISEWFTPHLTARRPDGHQDIVLLDFKQLLKYYRMLGGNMTGNSIDSGVCLSSFFSSRKVSQTFRSDCDDFAETRFPGEDVRPAPAQGYCSYTAFIGEDKVVQFRPPDHGLDVDIILNARRVFGDVVPETEFLGVVQDETGGASLHAYSMRKLPGASLLDARRSGKPNTKRAREMRRRIVKDFAKLQATSWENRIRNNEDTQRGLIGASLTWRARLLESALPDRLNKFAFSNLQEIRDLEQLPWTLTHGDLIPSNILVDPETGGIVGLLDWAEAEWLPFGVGLYGLEELLGEEVDGVFSYFPGARKLRRLFWSQLLSLVPELRANQQLLSTVKEAQILGVLLWHGIAFDDGRLDRVVEQGTDDAEISRLDAMLLGRYGLRSAKTCLERLALSFHDLCGFLAGK